MVFQVLVSTMHQTDYSLLDTMNIQSDVVVINQHISDSRIDFNHGDNKVTWINSQERGLSRSRNLALKNASGRICLLADDDLEYVPNYQDIVLEQFSLNPDYDIITFQVEGIERKFKNYYQKERRLGFLTSMKVSSVEIAFRLDRVREASIQFNEMFGSGARYMAGEDNIFLYDCLRRGLRIKYVPIKIAYLHIGTSTWFEGYNKRYFISKGAIFTAMSPKYSIPLILQFAIRKYALYRDEMTMAQAIKFMLKGRRQFLIGGL